MKSKPIAILLFIGIGFLLVSCASQQFIPKGSKDYGSYVGRFSGEIPWTNGDIGLRLYETPEGEIRFRGDLVTEMFRGQGQLVRGTVKGGRSLEGVFDMPAVGTLKGQLSEDRSYITGTFDSDIFKSGTWRVDRVK